MYIAGGGLLPENEKIRDISMSLARRAHKKAFRDTVLLTEPIGPYATRKTFDLAAALIHILYWIPPFALALLFLIILMPRPRPSNEEELFSDRPLPVIICFVLMQQGL